MHAAIAICSALSAHVCMQFEMQQACGARGTGAIPLTFNPYGGADNGWYGDHGYSDDDYFAWNSPTCTPNNDMGFLNEANPFPFRCCM